MSRLEKLTVLRAVEGTGLPVRAALRALDVSASTFYRWRRKFRRQGFQGLDDLDPHEGRGRRAWNQLLEEERELPAIRTRSHRVYGS